MIDGSISGGTKEPDGNTSGDTKEPDGNTSGDMKEPDGNTSVGDTIDAIDIPRDRAQERVYNFYRSVLFP
ncbi:hypothetical protein CV014_00145 [Nostoc sp. CMAA1605]|nr:hypothetical protein [Nostoc sp. CMAA1605]